MPSNVVFLRGKINFLGAMDEWHDFCIYISMRIAVTLFRNSVSPRIDIADTLLIYDIDNGKIKETKRCSLTFEYATQLISILQQKKITTIVCGGCPQFFLRMLLFHGFEVQLGLTGDPENIAKSLAEGKRDNLPPSSHRPAGSCCKRRRRSRKKDNY